MRKKGIALLLTVIIVSIVLGISMGISNIIASEIFLSNTGRQSQMAIYAADAGIDCAIFLDTHPGSPNPSPFATNTPSQNSRPDACAGDDIVIGGWTTCTSDLLGNGVDSDCTTDSDKKAGRSTFSLAFSNGSCVNVTVIKKEDYSDANFPIIATYIRADGHSSGASNDGGNVTCSSNNPRVFQRSLETTVFE